MPDHVLLVGMMGSGKTTVGREVARLMGRPFRDSDEEVVARTGRSVPELFAGRGEASFRAEERAALAGALSCGVASVIAVAGGAVIDPESRRRLRVGGAVVWLRASPATLSRRLGGGEGRPLLEQGGGTSAAISLIGARRRPVYGSLSDAVVDVDGIPRVEVAGRVRRAALAVLEAQRSA